jgi:Mg2+/Co2+ transporter CorC
VLEALGHQPRPGDAVTLDGVSIRVEAVDGLRLTKLLVTLGASDQGAPEAHTPPAHPPAAHDR